MKKILPIILLTMSFSTFVSAAETKILYHESKIPGPQTTKDYYIKESLRKENPMNPSLLQVKTVSVVNSPEGTTVYKMTSRINCATRQSAIIKYWSTGTTPERQRAMADGVWRPVDDFTDGPPLLKKICR